MGAGAIMNSAEREAVEREVDALKAQNRSSSQAAVVAMEVTELSHDRLGGVPKSGPKFAHGAEVPCPWAWRHGGLNE